MEKDTLENSVMEEEGTITVEEVIVANLAYCKNCGSSLTVECKGSMPHGYSLEDLEETLPCCDSPDVYWWIGEKDLSQ